MKNNNSLVQVTRHPRNKRVNGVLVAFPVTSKLIGIGWSLCRPGDQFNRVTGVEIANVRASEGIGLAKLPHSLVNDAARFAKRARKTFPGFYVRGGKSLPKVA